MGTPDFNAADIAARDAQIQDLQQQLADARRQEQYLTAVTRTTANLASERSLPLTLTAMAEEIVQADELVGVQVLTNEHASGKLHMLGMAGFPASLSSSFYAKLKQCEQLGADLLMLKAFHTSEPVVIENRYEQVMSDPTWEPLHEYHREPRWEDFASFPIIVRGKTVGILNAFVAPGLKVDTRSYAFLSSMAEQAAFAIDYASLLDEERQIAQRQERQKLARNLHDSVVQQVFSMGMLSQTVSILAQKNGVNVLERILETSQDLEDITSSVLKDLRMLVAQLKPTVIDEGEFRRALETFRSTTHRQTGLEISTRVDPAVDMLERELAEDLYHVIAEAVHNAVKHSSASEIDIHIAIDDQLMLTVQDNGNSANNQLSAQHVVAVEHPPKPGNGLSFMRERVERWQGEFSVDFGAPRGTVVRATMPVLIRQPQDEDILLGPGGDE
ncbi:MAG TPA: GAF domain-containing protein [Candidatus Yaniella excrementavium]|nr:GAF domain-containing protein [Candidatus Yaniella excrementavium]